MKIFISYSTQDEKIVRGLEKYISKEMIETWIDHKAIGGGSDLTKAIQKGIQRADIYFVFISLNSLASNWVDKEIKWAMQREEKLKYEFVVPVVLEIEALKRWDNKKLKDRKYITYNGDFHAMAHEIKNTIVNKTIEKFEYQCLLKKDILSNIGNVILTVFLAISFFTTPSQKEHIKYLSNISTNCLSSQVEFNDIWLITYASCPINNNKKLYSFGAFETILSREIQNDR